jgi:DNA-binding NarL/FixJ family response regulator
MEKIRVLIADDHAVLRAGLRMLIGAQPDMDVVGEAGDGREAVRVALETGPDVVTMDLKMPGTGGIKAVERLSRECPRSRVLVLTMHDDPAYLRAALAAGCAGYVLKAAAHTELIAAIRDVSAGRTFVDPHLAGDLLQSLAGPERASPPEDPERPEGRLSQRERAVLALLAQGHTNRVIADRLFLSVKTVETYRSRIAVKLGLKSRADFVRFALEIGLLNADGGASAEDDL